VIRCHHAAHRQLPFVPKGLQHMLCTSCKLFRNGYNGIGLLLLTLTFVLTVPIRHLGPYLYSEPTLTLLTKLILLDKGEQL
jgi:hypothetical protein